MDHCRPQHTISETRVFEWCRIYIAFLSEQNIRDAEGSVYTEKFYLYYLIYRYYFMYTENSIQPHINNRKLWALCISFRSAKFYYSTLKK